MPWRIVNNFEVQRLVLPVFVHYGFSHLVINILIQMIVGFIVEAAMGPLRMFIFYFSVTIGGSVFGSLINPQYAAGADPAVFGLFAAMFAMFIVYWKRLGEDNFG